MGYARAAAVAIALVAVGCARPGPDEVATPAGPVVAPIFDPATDVQYQSNGIDLTWVSVNEEEGWVEWAYGDSAAEDLSTRTGTYAKGTDWRTANPDRPVAWEDFANKRTHRVRLIGATPGSTIFYRIVSGGYLGDPHQAALPSAVFTTPDNFMLGRVTYEGGEPGGECLVYVQFSARSAAGSPGLQSGSQRSAWANTMSEGATGIFVLGVTNLRTEGQLDERFVYSNEAGESSVDVVARCGNENEGKLSGATSDLNLAGGQFREVDVVVRRSVGAN